jgi:hypothetical protein
VELDPRLEFERRFGRGVVQPGFAPDYGYGYEQYGYGAYGGYEYGGEEEHFIDPSLRPDLSAGALTNEDDLGFLDS